MVYGGGGGGGGGGVFLPGKESVGKSEKHDEVCSLKSEERQVMCFWWFF